MESCDIMISYDVSDIAIVNYLNAGLKKEGFCVWFLQPEDFENKDALQKKGSMVFACKVHVVVVSERSMQRADVKDEMSLAYTFRKPIYPISAKAVSKTHSFVPSGIMLMLASIKWTYFVKRDEFEKSMSSLMTFIRRDISGDYTTVADAVEQVDDDSDVEDDAEEVYRMTQPSVTILGDDQPSIDDDAAEEEKTHDTEEYSKQDDEIHEYKPHEEAHQQHPELQHEPHKLTQSYEPQESHQPLKPATKTMYIIEKPAAPRQYRPNINSDFFWQRHFGSAMSVPWQDFETAFLADYRARISVYGEEKIRFFVNILCRDIFETKDVVTKVMYDNFVGSKVGHYGDMFFTKLRQYVSASLALREVLDMDSTVRMTTIRHLWRYHSRGVITLLFDFVSDTDPNIRAVAALSLAKTGKKSARIEDQLMLMLEDEDRVVRESACLSLAHMRCQRAVPSIVDLWRNDAIKHVREAATLALKLIGGNEAAEAIKVTQILSDEMAKLRAPSAK